MKNKLTLFLQLGLPVLAITTGSMIQAKTIASVENLSTAHLVELNAYHKYIKYAEQAEKESYPIVGKLFRSAAFSELMHSRNHAAAVESLGGKTQRVLLKDVKVESTQKNLESSAKDERQDQLKMYAKFMLQAEKDGLTEAKDSFQFASDSELQHKKLFEKGFTLLGPKDVDYYVDVKSGETIEVHPDDTPPQSKLIGGAYVKTTN